MPRIVSFRIGPVWVAAYLNDDDKVIGQRVGLTCAHARLRLIRHHL